MLHPAAPPLKQRSLEAGQFAMSSLSWEVVIHPLQQLLPKVIHHRVSSKPLLVPVYGSGAEERDIQGQEEQLYVSWVLDSPV